MAVVAALSIDGNVLFTRVITYSTAHFVASAGCAQLSYQEMGVMYGLSVYMEDKKARLVSSSSSSARIVWQSYEDSGLLLVLIMNEQSDLADRHFLRYLDLIHDALVLCIGARELRENKNEMLRRELMKTARLVDVILTALASGSPAGASFGAVDTVLVEDSDDIQSVLARFQYAVTGRHGFLLLHGKVCAGAADFWTLAPVERLLLTLVIEAQLSTEPADELPVYLPRVSPETPSRLLVFELAPGVRVAVLCGADPSVSDVVRDVISPGTVWDPVLKDLVAMAETECSPVANTNAGTHDPLAVATGLCVFDTKWDRCYTRVRYGHPDAAGCLRALISWYATSAVVGTSYGAADGAVPPPGHDCVGAYMCTARHKLCYVADDSYNIAAAFLPNVPTYAMRSLTLDVLRELRESGLELTT